MSPFRSCLLLLVLLLGAFGLGHVHSDPLARPVYVDPESDFQSVMLRLQDGRLLLVFEKFNIDTFAGDLFATMSDDDGYTWSIPYAIISSSSNERHPSLIELAPDNLVLFYHKGDVFSNFRTYRATSEDGLTWTEQGALDLGWSSTGDVNPSVIMDDNGYLTMTYNRTSGPSYIARSHNEGVSWDHNKRQVSDGPSVLPRITKRESDGRYLVTYEVGTSQMEIYSKTSSSVTDWSAAEVLVTTGGTNQDSRPLVLEGGAFMVTFAHQNNNDFNLFYAISPDGQAWSERVPLTTGLELYKLEPFAMRQGVPGHVKVIWSQQKGEFPYIDQDIWILPDFTLDGNLDDSGMLVSQAFVRPGDVLTYTITLRNSGAFPLTVALADEMPADTTYVQGSLTATGGAYHYDAPTEAVIWDIDVPNGLSHDLSFAVTVAAEQEDGAAITNLARISDNLGVERQKSATAFVDAQPPLSAFISPVNGQLITDSRVLLLGSSSDTGSGVAVVQVRVDDGVWQTVSGLTTWSFQVDGLSEGRHEFSVQAIDALGNVALPKIIHIQVDTVPPFGNVEIYMPAIARP